MPGTVRTAKLLGFYDRGLTRVRVEYVGAASLQGSDDRRLVATLRKHGPAPAPERVMLASARTFVADTDEPVRRVRGPAPVPQARPFSLGDDDAPPRSRADADETPQSRPSELTAAARIERTMGPAPAMAWVTGPNGVPASGVLQAPAPVSAYAPAGGAPRAFISGRGLY
jgi:rare lipoprotein A